MNFKERAEKIWRCVTEWNWDLVDQGTRIHTETLEDIEQALQEAYKEGAEEMREKAAKVSVWGHKSQSPTTDLLGRGVADRIADAIRSLPLPGEERTEEK
jgi:hypothetical protein